jgi:hypothetical protein
MIVVFMPTIVPIAARLVDWKANSSTGRQASRLEGKLVDWKAS